MKKILIFASHPAQYLFFKNMITKLKEKGYECILLIKTKDILETLVKADGLEYFNIQPVERRNTKLGLFSGLVKRCIRILRIALKHKPDIFMGSDASLAHVARLINKPCITTLEDDYDVIPLLAKLTYPFTTNIVVPNPCKVGKWENKKIGYNGYMKLAYLHPDVFKPKYDLVKHLFDESKVFLIRVSQLGAHHDFGIKGLTKEMVTKLIKLLEMEGRVYVSSEGPIDEAYNKYALQMDTSLMHHFLAYTNLLICDSQSMSVEAAMLGVPSIRFSDFAGRISVLEEIENEYKLTCGIKCDKPGHLFEKVSEILAVKDMKAEFAKRRDRMLSEKINVTMFFTWLIENYPKSVRIMQDNPDYQLKFKRIQGSY